MDKKKSLGIIIAVCILLFIILIVILFRNNAKSIDIKLSSNYKSVIGIKVDSDILIVIDNKNRVSNILFLNDKSTLVLANQRIEGKPLSKAIELIVDKLKNGNEFNNGDDLLLTRYDNNSIYSNVLEELNKEFVIYGVDNKIIELDSTIIDKKQELNISDLSNDIESLYEFSIKKLKNL